MPPLSDATRPLMWNVSHGWVMYALLAIALAVCGWGIYRRIDSWRRGKEDGERFSDWGKRFRILLREVFLQKQVRNSTYPAVFHSLIFYSFLVLFATTLVIMVQYDADHLFGLNLNVFEGFIYVFFSVASELAGMLILVGIAMAAYRRYVIKPATLRTGREDSLILWLIAGVVVTGYLVEGLRIAANGDPWKALSPVGAWTAALFQGAGADAQKTLHASLWWLHTILVMSWLAAIPYTKFFHLLSMPTNAFFSKLKPRGELRREDIEALMESAESEDLQIGIETAGDMTWKQRMDVDTCISCGRCEEVCPAYMADKDYFTPRQLVERLKDSSDKFNRRARAEEKPVGETESIVGKAFDEEFIWHCRTCGACVEVCPALIDHVGILMELRRNEVLLQGRIPEEASRALRTYETGGNPFGPQSERVDWIRKTNVRIVAPGEKVDVLYWIGCLVSFDPQKRRIAEDLFGLLTECGVDFGVLGEDEICCGDPARVLGQEMLFQQTAKRQVEILKQRQFNVLLTGCPHCYNVLKNEYPQFGGHFNVVHHSEYIRDRIRAGDIKPKFGAPRRYVYHDPCYLGRYQNIYEPAREIIRTIPGATMSEMKNNREKSLCCGGGGGHFFMDLKRGERINNIRVRQARDAGADTIVTACGYCLHMLQDSLKLLNYDESMRVVDVATLTAESLEPQKD